MKRRVPIDRLPTDVRIDDAVEAACAADVDFVCSRLGRGTSVLVECDKELTVHFYLAVRARMRAEKDAPQLQLVDGRPRNEEEACRGTLANMLGQLTDAIRGSVDRRVLVLPHLDVLATTHTALTAEARELIPLLYENPEVLLLAFRDPSLPLPRVIEHVFGARREVVGVPREVLPKLITQREARAIDAEHLDPYGLYKYVSGLNPVRCRKLFEQLRLQREAPPGRDGSSRAYRFLRRQTAADGVELPEVDLDEDVGGYDEVKTRLREELIDLLRRKDALDTQEDIAQLEGLLPRGIIFHGPPGTGKTYLAKALATALDATVIVVSGPELKSKWVGESEENLRRVFRQARACAPAVVVFDEIDAFAQARGTYQGSGVEHSMVNQLLTEMDGFRRNEMVFVVGTTNFLASVDGALLRPGRFEFLIEVPAPDAPDREAITRIYDRKMSLGLSDDVVAHMVRRTDGLADHEQGLPFTGDHLYAVCRALKRQQIRDGTTTFTMADVDRALQRKTRRPVVLSAEEERVIAVHEAGHALLAMLLPGATPPERITIASDLEGALGYVLRAARSRPYAMTTTDMRAEVCVGLGGRAAEQMVFGDVSIGAWTDLRQATEIARAMVCDYGMSDLGAHAGDEGSEARKSRIDVAVDGILEAEVHRAADMLEQNRALHTALVDALLERKVLDVAALREIAEA